MTTGGLVDLDHLSSEQQDVLEFLLGELTIHQLLQLAAMLRNVRKHFGFGYVRIRVEQGHPAMIEQTDRDTFLPRLPEARVRELLKHTGPLRGDLPKAA